MEVETVGNLKFGMGECVPQEDVCPSADGMSSDATVLCIDSDAEDEVQSQDDFNPDLERRLKEKGLQGGPESHVQFKTFGQPTSVISNVPVHDGKQYTQEDLHGIRRNEGRVGEQEMFKIAQGGKKVSWGRQQEIEAKAVAAAMRSLEAKVKKQFGVGGQGSFYAPDDRWRADDMRGQRRKKVNNNINIGKEGKRGALYGPWAQEKKLLDVKPALCPQPNPQQQGQQQRGNKRRGRRGGRGRRVAEREVVDEVPKLEKSLEEELAEQMANQASNESALAQSFSSLRLHVAGGGTMIILNDREITDGESAEDILNELEQTPRSTISPTTTDAPVSTASSPPPVIKPPESERPRFPTRSSPPFRPQGMGMGGIAQPPRQHGVGPAMNAFRPNCRGCGAFFPPNLLAQVKGDPPLGMHLRRSSAFEIGRQQQQSSLRVPKLNARAMPFVPVGSPPSAAKHARSATHFSGISSSKLAPVRKNGTGCFIPMYVQTPDEKPTLNSCKLHKASLAESLSSLSEVDFSAKRSRLKLQPPPRGAGPLPSCENITSTVENASGDGNDSGTGIVTRCLRERSMSMGGCGLTVSKHVRNPTTPAEELLSLLDKEDEFTTFTSPLHLEETLEGLEAEQQALEETQEKMIDLEMENCDLKNTINSINTLTSEIDKLKCANTALQVMLFVALAKPENLRIGADIPRGMFGAAGQLELHELEAVQEKLTTKSTELLQIQKVLEKKNSELQALSNTWLNGLGKTKKKKEIAVSPKTKETVSTPPPPATARVLSGGKSDVVTPRRALSARGPSPTSKLTTTTATTTKTPSTLTRKPSIKTTTTTTTPVTVTKKVAEKSMERLPLSAREPTVPRRTLSGAESARAATTTTKKPTTPLVFTKRAPKKSLWR
ncbi:hypothetical protein BSKO_01778 [Bryopsis sp. KO-2023]|nr:hypothetical protein BSKO_01778 [Bryopsis sp. KO-2023]